MSTVCEVELSFFILIISFYLGESVSDVKPISGTFQHEHLLVDPNIQYIDAASRSQNNLILFIKTQYAMYETKVFDGGAGRRFLTLEFKEVGLIRELWPSSATLLDKRGEIDAAVRHVDDKLMLWFVNGFYFEANPDGGDFSPALLPQGRLFRCANEIYETLLGDLLNIKSVEEYRKFMSTFVPEDEERGGRTKTTAAAANGVKGRKIGYIVFGVFVGLIILIAVVAVMLNTRRGRGIFGRTSSSSRRRTQNTN